MHCDSNGLKKKKETGLWFVDSVPFKYKSANLKSIHCMRAQQCKERGTAETWSDLLKPLSQSGAALGEAASGGGVYFKRLWLGALVILKEVKAGRDSRAPSDVC